MTWNSSKAALRFLAHSVALHQEHPLGPRVHAVRAGEELDAGHLAHLVVDDEHGHRDVLIG